MDGEHPLRGGAEIIQDNIQKTIMKWHKLWVVTEEDKSKLEKVDDLNVLVPSFVNRLYYTFFGQPKVASQTTTSLVTTDTAQ